MKWNKYIGKWFLLFCLLACASCSRDEWTVKEEQPQTAEGDVGVYPGILQVKLSQEAADRLNLATRSGKTPVGGIAVLDSLKNRLGELRISRVFPPAGKLEARQKRAGLDCWFRIEYDKDQAPRQLAEQYAGIQDVEVLNPEYCYTIEPDPIKAVEAGVYGTETRPLAVDMPFNDPGLDLQWHYDAGNSGLDPKVGLGLFDGWKASKGSPEVIVAVIDMGVDATHEDLKDNMWVNEAERDGKYNVDEDGNGYKDDVYGYNFFKKMGNLEPGEHGTHVAGTVGAVNNNGKGVCGVAGGSGNHDGVRIMSCQISDASGSLKGLAEAFAYAANNGAVIAQCSWNIPSYSFDQALYDAIQYFVENAGCDENGRQVGPMKGGIAIFGAGNEGKTDKRYPAAYDNTVAVAALNEKNQRPAYTNYGSWVDISAPGGAGSGHEQKWGVYSTLPDNRYGYMNGASMACPHVSGVAALIVSQRKGPGFTNAELKRILFESVISLDNEPKASQMGRGALRADKALLRDDHVAPGQVTDLQVVQEVDLTFRLTWTVTADPNDRTARRYTVYYGTVEGSGTNWQQQAMVKVKDAVGAKMYWEIPAGQTLYLAVAGEDIWGNRSVLSNTVKREWKDKGEAPQQVTGAGIRVVDGEGYLFWKQVADTDDGLPALYYITASKGTEEVQHYTVPAGEKQVGSELSLELGIPESELPDYRFTLMAVDRWGNESIISDPVFIYVIQAHEVRAQALNGELALTWGKDFAGAKQISLYDLSGRKLMERVLGDQKAPGEESIKLPGLAVGMYIVRFEAGGSEIKKQILIR